MALWAEGKHVSFRHRKECSHSTFQKSATFLDQILLRLFLSDALNLIITSDLGSQWTLALLSLVYIPISFCIHRYEAIWKSLKNVLYRSDEKHSRNPPNVLTSLFSNVDNILIKKRE